jgi:hypothetical protein
MRDLVILSVHIITTLARLLGPGDIRSVVAESILIKQQLLTLNRSRQRSPKLRSCCRALCSLHSSRPPDPFRNRSEAFDSLKSSPSSEESKVSATLLTQAKTQARSNKRTKIHTGVKFLVD